MQDDIEYINEEFNHKRLTKEQASDARVEASRTYPNGTRFRVAHYTLALKADRTDPNQSMFWVSSRYLFRLYEGRRYYGDKSWPYLTIQVVSFHPIDPFNDEIIKHIANVISLPNSILLPLDFKVIHTLDLSFKIFSTDGAVDIAKAISSPHCSIHTLNLRGSRFRSEGLRHIAEAISSPDCTLHTLNLSHNNICPPNWFELRKQTPNVAAIYIANAISSPHCSLHTLNLDDNRLGLYGIMEIAQAISSPHCTLHTLHLSDNSIGGTGAMHIAKAISSPHCSLHTLDLNRNSLFNDVECGILVAQAISSPHCTLHTLKLGRNAIHYRHAEYIAKAISSPDCTLHTLYIHANKISDAGISLFAKAISSPHCTLHTLDLQREKGLTEASGVEHIANAISSPHCTLRVLYFTSSSSRDENDHNKRLLKAIQSPQCSLLKLSDNHYRGHDTNTIFKHALTNNRQRLGERLFLLAAACRLQGLGKDPISIILTYAAKNAAGPNMINKLIRRTKHHQNRFGFFDYANQRTWIGNLLQPLIHCCLPPHARARLLSDFISLTSHVIGKIPNNTPQLESENQPNTYPVITSVSPHQ